MSVRHVKVVIAAGLFCALAIGAAAEMDEVPMVRLEIETAINAAPADVWLHLTSGKSLVGWCPYWKSEANSKVSISKVGDVLEFKDDWGNTGRSIITFVRKPQEIRIAHEPADGSYICQSKFVLEPEGGKTRVVYVEQYTDESEPEDFEATAEQMETQMRKTLATLKKTVEAKP